MKGWNKSIKLALCIILLYGWNLVDSSDKVSISTHRNQLTKPLSQIQSQTLNQVNNTLSNQLQLYDINIKELPTECYHTVVSDSSIEYVLKQDVKCTLVKCNDKVVWKLYPSFDDKYPTSVYFKPNLIYIYFQPFYNAYRYDSVSTEWVFDASESFPPPNKTSNLRTNHYKGDKVKRDSDVSE